jgi:hypothetical protein
MTEVTPFMIEKMNAGIAANELPIGNIEFPYIEAYKNIVNEPRMISRILIPTQMMKEPLK